MSVSTIDLKISTSQEKAEVLLRKDNQSWQKQVDDLLDRMNELNNFMTSLHSILLGLTFEIDREYADFKKSEYAPKGITAINLITAKMLRLVRKSDLYPGVKSNYFLLKQENNYLRELLADVKTSKELENDEEMKKIVKDTVKILEHKYKAK
jgi:hypothetical protein